MTATAKKTIKIIGFSLLAIIAAMILTVVIYVLYVVFQYNRIADNQSLKVENNVSAVINAGENYSIATYNIGFGAYDREFSFFMDEGIMNDGTKVTGKYGKAVSKQRVLKNTNGALAAAKEADADFLFLQEVDTDSTRSYGINQLKMAKEALGGSYSVNFAVNFHSAYLFWPLSDPHGQSNAGIATFSKYNVTSAVRRSFPLDNGFAKFFDLDRCFSLSRLPVSGGKELVLINSHMSAYDEGGSIRKKQLNMLNSVLSEEYEKGNYVIAGGDFNHDIAGTRDNFFPSQQKIPPWVFQLTDEDLAEHFSFAAANNAPTCRGADIPYKHGVTYTVVIDGFAVSDNITVNSVENVDTGFEFSDHNPAKMTFTLN